ncbi:MAG: putative Histone acetyltransferase [Streblomastix strix]|uniref:Putative Histone acetyltransferase n=1 Tax=Streblomastix strix TaxID=222440 RepID=A0A5J4WLE1_9EUKA|nr:MAG: putative Histone acetyltransferase [Streblomastix strix]
METSASIFREFRTLNRVIREAKMQAREKSGNIRAVVIKNDAVLEIQTKDDKLSEAGALMCSTKPATPQALVLLVQVKNLISRQLPHLPREYITRLLFDRNHHTIVLLKNNIQIVVAITMRIFVDERLGEIAFCAVDGREQSRGYGTRAMDHTKEYARTIGLTRLLTCADNKAIVYFEKQGFHEACDLEGEDWKECCMYYKETTPMEIEINPHINHLEITEMISKQRSVIMGKIAQFSRFNEVHIAPDRACINYALSDGKSDLNDSIQITVDAQPFEDQIQDLNKEVMEDVDLYDVDVPKAIPVSCIPGITKQLRYFHVSSPNQEYIRRIHEIYKVIFNNILSHDDIIWPFVEPVDSQKIEDYYEIVHNPVDMTVIKARLYSGTYYITPELFKADLQRMVTNAKLYNKVGTPYHDAALALQILIKHEWDAQQWPQQSEWILVNDDMNNRIKEWMRIQQVQQQQLNVDENSCESTQDG